MQSAFALNAILYKKNGLLYADLDNNFSAAIKGEITSGNGVRIAAASGYAPLSHIDAYDLERLFNSFDTKMSHLISSEWLSECPIEFFEEVEQIVKNKFQCVYIACIRSPVNLIKSNYLQGLKTGIFFDQIESEYTKIIPGIKKQLRLIINLRKSLIIGNYDIHKGKLIAFLDNSIFGRPVSKEPISNRVNLSPNFKQSEILRLVNYLKISNFGLAMKYIESSGDESGHGKKISLSHSLCESIMENLSDEIFEINSMLPENEKILQTCAHYEDALDQSIFTPNDINFMNKLISARPLISSDDVSFIKRSIENFLPSTELPSDFDALGYLLLNPDVLRARVDPAKHYLMFGKKEGRKYQ